MAPPDCEQELGVPGNPIERGEPTTSLLGQDLADHADRAPGIVPDINEPNAGHPTHLFEHEGRTQI